MTDQRKTEYRTFQNHATRIAGSHGCGTAQWFQNVALARTPYGVYHYRGFNFTAIRAANIGLFR